MIEVNLNALIFFNIESGRIIAVVKMRRRIRLSAQMSVMILPLKNLEKNKNKNNSINVKKRIIKATNLIMRSTVQAIYLITQGLMVACYALQSIQLMYILSLGMKDRNFKVIRLVGERDTPKLSNIKNGKYFSRYRA